ncbi:zinc finger BED domain-containing protein 1-like [Rhagoletis pomonella]|uniref:zinc finger BED domain-containing protein 1-like n=1 Tax=Rhagoletis pomonella TaxID=28610 RepID=UPI00177F1D0D|nr:zinc finger BED domain-containing protein 1-like [Rhagoletis pomonella]
MPAKRSFVLNNFKNWGAKKPTCKHCSSQISYNGGSVGNLKRHMKLKHPFIPWQGSIHDNEDNEDDTPVEQPNQTQPSAQSEHLSQRESQQPVITNYISKQPTTKKADKINHQLVKMIAKGHHALRLVEEPEMVKFVSMVSQCGGYKLPAKKTLSQSLIPKVYNDLESEIKSQLQDTFAVCLTTDGWTSSTNISYIAVTAHFIDKNTTLCSALLCCRELDCSHTGENLYGFLKEVTANWGISNKVAAIVTDNAANALSGVRLGEWRSIGCFAHLLNLIVQKAITGIPAVVDKVKNIVVYFNRSSQALKKLKDFQVEMQLPILKLKKSVPTRWKSTYDMLARIIEVKDAVMSTIAILRPDLIIDTIEWEIIEGSLPLLKPFYGITTGISSEIDVTLSKVIVFINLIQRYLAKTSPKNEKLSLFYRSLRQGFREPNACDTAIQNLKNKIVQTDYSQTETKVVIPDSQAQAVNNIWYDYDKDVRNIVKPQNKTVAAIVEVNRYLSEPYLDRNHNPLEWWHVRKETYPNLYRHILKRFCIVATSVPCERVFSSAGLVIRDVLY